MFAGQAVSSRILVTCFALFTLLIRSTMAGELAKNYHAPASDVMTLPHYCWAQYMLSIPDTPEFTIPKDLCGIGTNHMCSGLLQVHQAKMKWRDADKRGFLLTGARGDFQYTLTAIRDYPNCPIRGDAEKAMADANQLLQMAKHR